MAPRRSRQYALYVALASVGVASTVAIGTAAASTALPIDGLDEALEGTTTLRGTIIPLFGLVTVLSLAPAIVMMTTCFPFIAVVFSFLRQALGLQSAPPGMMLTSLALFLTFFIMEPVAQEAWEKGLQPYTEGRLTEAESIEATLIPVRRFMLARVEPQTLVRLADAAQISVPENQEPPTTLLVTAFMLSELTRAFQIGFAIFIPFLMIDLVIASVLMAMGMMMVPPAVVALPFKVGFFIIADGWVKLSEAILRGYLQ